MYARVFMSVFGMCCVCEECVRISGHYSVSLSVFKTEKISTHVYACV